MALQPVLAIGVGGSGVKTIRSLRQVLLRRLRSRPGGWPHDDLPAAWQLLGIDIESNQAKYPEPILPPKSFLPLVRDGGGRTVYYRDVVNPMVQGIQPGLRAEMFGGWVAERYDRRISSGAHQQRAIGRAVSSARLRAIRDRLARAVEAIRSEEAKAELLRVAEGFGASGTEAPVVPLVVSSMAGGTGAGIFLDVIEVMRAVDADLGRTAKVVLYTPDIFGELRPGEGQLIPANALAAAAEITAGVWGGGIHPGTAALYASQEVGANAADPTLGSPAFGTRYHFLVGRVNAVGTSVAAGDAAYRAVGDVLGALVSDEAILGAFEGSAITNVFENSHLASNSGETSGLSVPGDPQCVNPFSALGAGRVSVGTERFLEFAVEGFGRRAVERLLWPRLAGADAQERIGDRVAAEWDRFLRGSGLDEGDRIGPDGTVSEARDVIIDALGVDHDRVAREFAQQVLDAAGSGAETTGLRGSEWAQRIRDQLAQRRDALEVRLADLVNERAAEFCRVIESHLLRQASRYVALHGLRVTAGLVDRLAAEVRDVADQQLPREAERRRTRWSSDVAPRIMTMLEGAGEALLKADDPGPADVRSFLERSARQLLGDAIRRETAAEILRAVARELLPRLSTGLTDSAEALARDVLTDGATDRRGVAFAEFCHLDTAPGDRLPIGPTEHLLLDPGEFPALLEAQLRSTVGEDLAVQWAEVAVERMLLGRSLAEREDEREEVGWVPATVVARTSWVPGSDRLRWALGMRGQRPTYAAPEQLLDVLELVEARLRDRETDIGRFVAQSIGEFLAADDRTERAAREERFVAAFEAAMETSAPFIEVNHQLVNLLHPAARESLATTSKVISRIPVAPDSPLAKRLVAALERKGLMDGAVRDALGGTVPSSAIDVFQVLATPLSSMAFPALMQQAWNSWHRAVTAPSKATPSTPSDPDTPSGDAVEAFWMNRRSRPLLEAIPMAARRLEEFLRGWTVGTLLGLVVHAEESDGSGGAPDRVVRVLDVQRGDWIGFPRPLVRRTAAGHNVLPAVLESLPIAMAECGGRTHDVEPLRPYRATMHLGRGLDAESGLLARWILHGEVHEGLAAVPASAGDPAASAADRRDAVRAALAATAAGLRDHVARVLDVDVDKLAYVRDGALELRGPVEAAIGAVDAAAAAIDG